MKLDVEAEPGELCNEAPCLGFGRAVAEVIGTEIAVGSAVLQHMVDGGEDRGGNGADGLLWSAPALQAEKLGPVIAALRPLGGPSALDEHRLEPRGAFAQFGRLSLAGALVLAGTQSRPGDEVPGRREPAHVAADLR